MKVGTIFEARHIQMRDWLVAIHLICSSKKGISANQLSRTLGITLKSAWFMAHRIREAFKPNGKSQPMGGDGGFVEADETYYGKNGVPNPKHPRMAKNAVMALVERGGGIRSLYMPLMRKADAHDVVKHYVSPKAHLHTDEAKSILDEKWVASHATVNHSKDEYVARSDHQHH